MLHVLPQLYFRNTWTWHCTDEGCTTRPSLRFNGDVSRPIHESLEQFWFACDDMSQPENWAWLFTDNETNAKRHPDFPSESEYYKDAFHDYVIVGGHQSC